MVLDYFLPMKWLNIMEASLCGIGLHMEWVLLEEESPMYGIRIQKCLWNKGGMLQ